MQTERIPVVTAFLYSGEKVALVRRSERVRTYRGAWAAFSGYIERLPLNQARQELAEEAGLADVDTRLTGIGIPLPVDDEQSGHRWLVFPFLFELEDSADIKTNWEAAEWGWFSPEEVGKLNAVPGLDVALGRVWPPFGDRAFWHGLSRVAADTDQGATELARRGLAALGGFVQAQWQSLDQAALLRAVRAFAACRPAMGVFPNLAARLLLAVEREGGQFEFDELLTELLGAVEDATDLSVSSAADALEGKTRLFTLSYSEAVRDAIVAWRTGAKQVTVAESGPRNEGVRLAEDLSSRGVQVRTVPDAEILSAVEESDAVLVGCDAITGADAVLNKIGTLQAVTAANDGKIPAYAIAQTFKIAPPGWPVFLEPQSPADFGETEGTQAGSAVFDLTPLDLFDAVFTEEGALSLPRLSEIRAELGSVELIPGA
ncbi:MAG TPA: NUDIX domain-containing protein [Armatimonadota bacterium]|nr:NUDIX domain-containing protein [Armatimonadota bacterium]